MSPALLPLVLSLVPAAPSELPSAGELLGRYRQALGDPTALARVESVTFHGRSRWGGIEGEGFVTEVYAGLRKARTTTEFAVFGRFETGTDGEVVWEKTPLGVQLREGWGGCQYMRSYGLTQHVDWREMYSRAKTIGSKELSGKACWEVHLTPRKLIPIEGDAAKEVPPPDILFFEAETGLLHSYEARSVGLLDEPVVLAVGLGDWKAVDGILYPHRAEVRVSGFTLINEYDSVQHDLELAPDFFRLDAEVVAEVAKREDPDYEKKLREPRVETLPVRHIASIRVQCKRADMQKTLAVLLPETLHHVTSSGATMDGQPLVRYHSWGDPVDLEAAMPVKTPVKSKGRVLAETLPAGPAVVAWHDGPYEKLGDTHVKIQAFMKANGLEKRDAPWEEYWTDPGMEPDPSKWRTKIVQPVRAMKDEG